MIFAVILVLQRKVFLLRSNTNKPTENIHIWKRTLLMLKTNSFQLQLRNFFISYPVSQVRSLELFRMNHYCTGKENDKFG